MLKNYEWKSIITTVPLQLLFSLVASLYFSFIYNDPDFIKYFFKAIIYILKKFKKITEKRLKIQKIRKISDKYLFSTLEKIDVRRIFVSRKTGPLLTIHLKKGHITTRK